MKKNLLSLIFSAIALSSFAQYNFIAVYSNNGVKNLIPINEANEISINGNYLTIGTRQYDIFNLEKYEFTNSTEMGIEDITGDLTGFIFDSHGFITIPTRLAKEKVNVFNVNGFKCAFKIHNGIIDISSLNNGIYIFTIGDISFKFFKQ